MHGFLVKICTDANGVSVPTFYAYVGEKCLKKDFCDEKYIC